MTGGASGIGLASGRALAEAGCKVMLADIEKTAHDEALASVSGSGPEIRGVVCDVADPTSVDAAAELTFSAFGKVDISCKCVAKIPILKNPFLLSGTGGWRAESDKDNAS